MDRPVSPGSVVHIQNVSLRYGDNLVLDNLSVEIPADCMAGLIGPDGVGKSSLMSLLTGARMMQQGRINVLGGDISNAAHRRTICPRIAYMPQGLGSNLYHTLSVFKISISSVSCLVMNRSNAISVSTSYSKAPDSLPFGIALPESYRVA